MIPEIDNGSVLNLAADNQELTNERLFFDNSYMLRKLGIFFKIRISFF
jgi:hypothetical protein